MKKILSLSSEIEAIGIKEVLEADEANEEKILELVGHLKE